MKQEYAMANLYIKSAKDIKSLKPDPFESEEAFENEVFESSEMLGDLIILKRQIRGGGKAGIPDIVAIDSDGRICIIEMKNHSVDSGIIPQILQYAIWAETNPDSIKSLWLEAKNRPDDIALDWDNLEVRIMVVAPQIMRSTLDFIDKINYRVDLVEVNRWKDVDNELFLVNYLEPDPKVKSRITSGLPVYDRQFYETIHDHHSVDQFLKYADKLKDYVKQRGWKLERKFTKYYCGFKSGNRLVFGIEWSSDKEFEFFFKVDLKQLRNTEYKSLPYSKPWKEAYIDIEPAKTKIKELSFLFEAAYRNIVGE
jgi:hypothetical protein